MIARGDRRCRRQAAGRDAVGGRWCSSPPRWPPSRRRSTTPSSRSRCATCSATSTPASPSCRASSPPTRSPSRRSCSPAARSPTSSAGAGCSSPGSPSSPRPRPAARWPTRRPQLIAWRAVQGVGAALVLPGSLAVLSAAYPQPAARARAVGLWAATGATALVAGPLVGGLLVEAAGWPAVFWVNLPLCAAVALVTAVAPAGPPPSGDRRLDVPGQVLAAVGLAAATYAVVLAGRDGLRPPVLRRPARRGGRARRVRRRRAARGRPGAADWPCCAGRRSPARRSARSRRASRSSCCWCSCRCSCSWCSSGTPCPPRCGCCR